MRRYLDDHPDRSTWILLSLAFLLALAWAARGVDLAARQWLVLAAASVLTAGLCAWIISWEADDREAGPDSDLEEARDA